MSYDRMLIVCTICCPKPGASEYFKNCEVIAKLSSPATEWWVKHDTPNHLDKFFEKHTHTDEMAGDKHFRIEYESD